MTRDNDEENLEANLKRLSTRNEAKTKLNELETELKLLQWHKLANEAAIKAALLKNREISRCHKLKKRWGKPLKPDGMYLRDIPLKTTPRTKLKPDVHCNLRDYVSNLKKRKETNGARNKAYRKWL